MGNNGQMELENMVHIDWVGHYENLEMYVPVVQGEIRAYFIYLEAFLLEWEVLSNKSITV